MRKILELILSLIGFWREKEAERIAEETQIKDEARESIDRIKDLADVGEDKDLAGRVKAVTDKAKDLGIVLLLALCLGGTAQAQIIEVDSPQPLPAEARIAVYSHEDLKEYTLEIVNLAREQERIIAELSEKNRELVTRLHAVTTELGVVSGAVNSLGATRQKSALMHVADWSLKILPAILGVIAVAK